MIYSIGHGNKTFDRFLTELKSFGIEFVIDVRTKPYSQYNPQFNREILDSELGSNEVKYVYMGDCLGGLPADQTCYTDGKVDYEKVSKRPFFQEGLERLRTAHRKKFNVAIMCSESKPEGCHRSKLIGQQLRKNDISVIHILEVGKAIDQEELLKELTSGMGPVDLFGNEVGFTSRNRYRK